VEELTKVLPRRKTKRSPATVKNQNALNFTAIVFEVDVDVMKTVIA